MGGRRRGEVSQGDGRVPVVAMTEPLDDAQIEAIAQRVKDLLAQERCSKCQCSHSASEPPREEQPVQDRAERSSAEAAAAPYASRIGRAGRSTSEPSISGQDGIYPDLDSAVAAAGRAFRALDAATLEKRHEIIAAMRAAMRANAELLARMAWEETGLGRVEDKIKKNHLVIDKTPGPEILQPTAWTGDRGLALVERAPYGVFGVITPSHESHLDDHQQRDRPDLGRQRGGLQRPSERQEGLQLSDPAHQPGDRRGGRPARPADRAGRADRRERTGAHAAPRHPHPAGDGRRGGGQAGDDLGQARHLRRAGQPAGGRGRNRRHRPGGQADRLRGQLRQQHHLRRREGSLRRRSASPTS